MPKLLWDDVKRTANLEKHRMDFAVLTEDFFADAVIVRAKGGRSAAVGWFDGRPITVIFMYLGREALAIISMRPASERERRLI